MRFALAFEAFLKLARAALASLLLVGVPLADAAACAGEDMTGHVAADRGISEQLASASAGSGDIDHGGRPSGDAQHCVHGHCHHSTPFRTADPGVKPASATAVSAVRPVDQPIRQRAAGGLERPPKL